MTDGLIVAPLLGGAALALRSLARWLGRPMPGSLLAVFFVLAALPFGTSFVSNRTALPLDHVPLTHPWLPLGTSVHYNPWLSDITSQLLPWTEAVRSAWRGGELPLRDRWNGCGTPLAANGPSAAFSPLTMPALVLALPAAFLFAAVLKLALAMTGLWLWAAELGASRRAAAFAAVSFGLSMTFTQWAFFPQTAVLCLWPWMLFCLECLRDSGRRRRAFVVLAGVLIAAMLAGHPESVALGVLFAVLWLAGRWLTGDLPDAGRLAVRFLGAGIVAAGATAFLALPTLYAVRASNRLVLAAAPHWSPHLSVWPHGAIGRAWVTAFFPYALGDLIHGPVLRGSTGAVPEMDLGYFGIVGWVAALLVLRPGSRRLRAEPVLVALAVAGLGGAFGAWPFAELFSSLPGIRHMFPLRFASWAALAGPVVGALELDRLARDAAERRRGAVAGAVAVAAGLLALAWIVDVWLRPEHAVSGDAVFQRKELIVAMAALLSTAALLAAVRARPSAALGALAAVAAAELLYQWHDQYRFYSKALLYPETPLIRFLHSTPGTYRVAGMVNALFPNTGIFAGVEDVRSHDAIERRDYVTFLDATCGYPPADYFKHIGNPDASVFDFLNVRYMVGAPEERPPGPRWAPVYAGRDGVVFENGGVLPRAFVPATVRLVGAPSGLEEPVADANAAFGAAFAEVTANADWRARAWVLWSADGEVVPGPAGVSDYRESVNAISFRARVESRPSCVVVSVVQDGGWSGREADGAPLDLRRANGPFLAVVLPPGDHVVRLRYRPPGFAAGVFVSALTFVTAVGLAWSGRRRGARP